MTSPDFRDILSGRGVNRLIVLRKRSTPCPKELARVLSSLDGLSLSVEDVHDPLTALARICFWVNHDQPRIKKGDPPQFCVALLHAERDWASDAQSGVSELIGFLKKVLPMISLWIVCEDGTTYEQSASTWVPPAQSANGQSPTDSPLPSEVSGEPIGYGTFRLTGHEEPEEASAQSTPEEIDPNAEETAPKDKEEDLDPKQRRTTSITKDELDLLLGNDPEDGDEDTRRPDSAEPEDPEE